MRIEKIHNRFSEVLKKCELGLPCTAPLNSPRNKWLDEISYTNLSIIDLTYGGGMGGSHETLYCKRINNIYDYLMNNKFIEVESINGNKYVLNRQYIVKANNNYKMVSAYLENYNTIHPIGINQFNYLVPNDNEITLKNEYSSDLP